MRLTRVEIRHFRSIRNLALDLGDTTVFIGPNNVGKTAILDAVRLAMTRCWGRSGSRFGGSDVGAAPDGNDGHGLSGASIVLRAEESAPEEWPRGIADGLDPANGTESSDGRRSLVLRIRFGGAHKSDTFEESWEFLDAEGEPICRHDALLNGDWMWRHFPVFYLGVSREVDGIVLPRPGFWKECLKALEIPVGLEAAAEDVLERFYARLREGDPRTKNIMHAIVESNPLERGRWYGPDLGLLPDDVLDEFRWMEAILDVGMDERLDSFDQRGLAAQSLAVMNLSRAFARYLHNEMYGRKSRPVIIVEEPEAHLSPQAARLLWRHVRALPGQKIVTTHSPYFVQHVPFRDLRLVRFTENGTEVKSLPSAVFASMPELDGLDRVVRGSNGSLQYERASQTLAVRGMLGEKTYRALLTCCGQHGRRRELEGVLRDLRDRSLRYVDDDELRSLETFARRIRGEIFFAECWMIVEGPTDYLIVHALAHAMRYDLDSQGVSVIDAKNNGSPQAFACLARALDIPWIAVFDGDAAGKGYIKQLAGRGFGESELQDRCRLHAAGDLEAQLLADGLGGELRKILEKLGVRGATGLTDEVLLETLRKEKTRYAAELADRIRGNRRIAQCAPEAFRAAIGRLPTLKITNKVDGNAESAAGAPSGETQAA